MKIKKLDFINEKWIQEFHHLTFGHSQLDNTKYIGNCIIRMKQFISFRVELHARVIIPGKVSRSKK